MNNRPPNWMIRFFRWFCREDLVDAVEGDLLERFDREAAGQGRFWASIKFLINVLRFFQPMMIKPFSKTKRLSTWGMFRANFIFFGRSLKRHRAYSLLNISGLMLGVAAFTYMMGFVQYERSYDAHHENADRVFRVASQKVQDGDRQLKKASASVALASHLKSSFPEIVAVSRVHILDASRQIIQVMDDAGNTTSYTETKGFHAEDGYFDIFSDKVLMGDKRTALREPNSVVLTETLAKKYFGNVNPVGKVLKLTDDFEMDYKVTAVVEDVPATAHFQYDLLISFNTFKKQRPNWRWTSWDWDYFHTYILVKPGADIEALEEKINSSVATAGRDVFEARGYEMEYMLQSLPDIHLQSDLVRELSENGNGRLLDYVEVIAIFILVLGWVNYVNLSTARATLRAKEIGVRKVTGAGKHMIMGQLLTEAFLLNVLATMAGLSFLLLISPRIASLTGYTFELNILVSGGLGVQLLLALVVGSILSGAYPAMVLSGYEPIKILKGNFKTSKQGLGLRRALVVFQLVVSLVLFVGAMSVYRQISFLSNRDLGIDLEQVLVVNMPNLRDDSFWQDYDRFKTKALDESSVSAVTTTNFIPGAYLNHVELLKLKEQNVTEAKVIKHAWVDFDFISLFDLQLVAGRNFDRERPSELRTGIIVNESAARLLGFQNAEGLVDQPVTWVHSWGDTEEYTAIGVINDYDQHALGSAEPMVYIMNRPQTRWYEVNYISLKVSPDDVFNTVNAIGKSFEEVYPSDSFDYFFLDDHFNQSYNAITSFGKLLGVFTFMAIVISLIGLFGLIAFVALQRKKEVSIRKLLGAKVADIIGLLSKQFVGQFFIALVIATPIIYFGLSSWLSGFTYQMPVSPDLFLIPAVAIGLMVLCTVLYQGVSVSLKNPTDNLRNE